MPKHFAVTIILYALLACSNVSASTNIGNINRYIQDNFANKLQISESQIQQLSWIEGHKKCSFERDMQVASPEMHIEIVRALTRLYCLQLLKSGTQQDYKDFIKAQLDANEKNPLSFNSFKKLSRHVQSLEVADHELLETATILSAVSLSEHAYKLAQGLVNLDNSANDNLAFLTTTVRVNDDIYPLIKQLSIDHHMAKKMLYILFPPQTNFRHMLYTEGGAGMFKYLRSMIKHQYLTQNEMDLWYAHWIVNIAGFRGHVASSGSLYLTEPVFHAMDKLHDLTNYMLQSPNFDPLMPYLEYRADLLGYTGMPQRERIFLAHVAAMLRIYEPIGGKQLQLALANLPLQLCSDLQEDFFESLHDYQKTAPTYVPALLGNTMVLLNEDISETLQLMLPIYHQAITQYKSARQTRKLASHAVLSFNKLSSSKNICQIIKLGAKSKDRVKILADGEVIVYNTLNNGNNLNPDQCCQL